MRFDSAGMRPVRSWVRLVNMSFIMSRIISFIITLNSVIMRSFCTCCLLAISFRISAWSFSVLVNVEVDTVAADLRSAIAFF